MRKMGFSVKVALVVLISLALPFFVDEQSVRDILLLVMQL